MQLVNTLIWNLADPAPDTRTSVRTTPWRTVVVRAVGVVRTVVVRAVVAVVVVAFVGLVLPQSALAEEEQSTQEGLASTPKLGDPASIWPDPLNESQLGTEASYYYYARDDGQSLLHPPTHEDPLRIWVGGDSMAGGAWYGLRALLGYNPNYELVIDIRKSTGNVADWYFDWPHYMATEVAEAGYDVIVLSMGANDNQRFRGINEDAGAPAWVEQYKTRLKALFDAAARPGRLVVWIGLPHMEPEKLRPVPDLLNPLFAAAADAVHEAHFVDAAAIVSPDGRFVRRLEGESDDRNVRLVDGVHYTFYGGKLISEVVVAEIQRQFGLGAADEG